jgi:plastocyanin
MTNSKFKLAALVMAAFLLVGCTAAPANNNSNNDGATGTNTPTTDGNGAATDGSTDGTTGGATDGSNPATTKTVSVSMSSFSFNPKEIEVEAGSTLIINLSNSNGQHDFVIDELNVESNVLNSGGTQTLTIQIPANAAGKQYEYYCSVGSHRAMGMVGTLKVN